MGCRKAVTKPRIYIYVPGLKGLQKTPKIFKYKLAKSKDNTCIFMFMKSIANIDELVILTLNIAKGRVR